MCWRRSKKSGGEIEMENLEKENVARSVLNMESNLCSNN